MFMLVMVAFPVGTFFALHDFFLVGEEGKCYDRLIGEKLVLRFLVGQVYKILCILYIVLLSMSKMLMLMVRRPFQQHHAIHTTLSLKKQQR